MSGCWQGFKSSVCKLFEDNPNKKFGTWDGVFASCIINVIGVILFARMGFIVGNTGIWEGILLVIVVTFMSAITILSTAGICSTCALTKGGVYAIIKQALGTQVGGTVGIVYVVGLAIVNAVYILGFAEAVCEIANWTPSYKNFITIGLGTEAVLLCIILGGVGLVVKLQFLLLFFLIMAMMNFIVGGLISHGAPTYMLGNYTEQNLYPISTSFWDFFSIFGLFFSTTTGIMAGANMSGDLRTPSVSIPIGTLAAIACSAVIYLTFMLILAASVPAATLIDPAYFLIAKDLSGSEAIFFIGMFIASVSSSLGIFIGAPRVLQGIGEDIPIIGFKEMSVGFGQKDEPVRATFFVAIVSACFIIIGNLNAVAPVMTTILLITYAVINYAYFALATGGLREEAENKQREMLETMEMDNMPSLPMKDRQIFETPPDWVLTVTNRWVSLLIALWHFVAMFLLNWWQGLAVLGVFLFFYIYIGVLNRANNNVGDADFSLREWINPLHHPSRKGHRDRQIARQRDSMHEGTRSDEISSPFSNNTNIQTEIQMNHLDRIGPNHNQL